MNYNHDNIISELFWDNNTSTKAYRRFNQKQKCYRNIYNYLLNRFDDSESIYESLLRIVYKIYDRPKCPVCGNKLKFIGKPNNKGIFTKHCSISCRQKDPNVYKKQQITSLEKYGSCNNIQKTLQTKLEKYGDKTFNNTNKAKETNLKRYGEESVLKITEIHNKGIEAAKTKESKIKRKTTNIKKFGGNSPMSSNEIKNKVFLTKIKKYNDATYNNRNKARKTIIDKYGYYYINTEKIKKTKLDKYGDENYNNIEKTKNTYIKKYNVTHPSKLSSVINKIQNTKNKNKTFNTSKPEDESYLLLKEKYPDVIRQYKSDKYPWRCDFYVPCLDLYIECNYMWTHGLKPFENTEADINKKNIWELKNTKFYKSAIITWTIMDVKKRNTAKENKLNYLEFFNIKDLKEWLKKE